MTDETNTTDSDELQTLFDEIASGVIVVADGDDASTPSARGEKDLFNRVGLMTRQVHDTIRAVFGDDKLASAVQEIPDARQRLNYISVMTEQAASRVLNATDEAKPLQDEIQQNSGLLLEQWDKVFANELSVDEFKALAIETRAFMRKTHNDSQTINSQLTEIMMAQDFQDLTGQVIKKVTDLAQTLESQLLGLLIEVTPDEKRATVNSSLLNGPAVDATQDNVMGSQEEVDDLLDSLGF